MHSTRATRWPASGPSRIARHASVERGEAVQRQGGCGDRNTGLDGRDAGRRVAMKAAAGVVALLGTVLPGWVVQKLLLLGAFVVGGAGAGRLARTVPGAVAAAVLWSWSP